MAGRAIARHAVPMWSNLLSGAVGAVIGLVGAVAAAMFTVRKEATLGRQAADEDHRNAVQRAEDQRGHDAAGRMAVKLVAIYDALTELQRRESDPVVEDVGMLREGIDELRRSIVLDGPLVPTLLEQQLKDTRKAIAEGIPPRSGPPSRQQVSAFREQVDMAGKAIQRYRRPTQGVGESDANR